MSAKGKATYSNNGSNPHDLTGVLVKNRGELYFSNHVYEVRWNNGYFNLYRLDEIEYMQIDFSEEELNELI